MGGAYRKNIEVSFSLAGAMALLDDASDERQAELAAVLKEFIYDIRPHGPDL